MSTLCYKKRIKLVIIQFFFYMLKYENSTLKIYIRTVKHYTDIDPTVDFVFTGNKIDCANSGKNSLFIVTLWNCPSSLQLLLPVIQTIFFRHQDFQSAEKKIFKNVFFLVQNRRNFTLQKLPVIQYSHVLNWLFQL